MKRACVIGWPIEHFRSPLIHGYWLARYGIAGTYTKIAVPPAELSGFLASFERNGYVGCNVTVPHKEDAYRLADEREPSAVAVGAANTLWLENGRLHAANTDTYGFMTYLDVSTPGWCRKDAPVTLFGAGGAARAIAYGFVAAGVDEVRVVNRSRGRAEELARQLGPRIKVFDWAERSRASREASVLVNTTTVGMKGKGVLDIDFDALARDCVVADIVYVPLETAFLKAAMARGFRTVDGLGMLLHQAVPGFEKWFGVRPEVDSRLYALVAADIGAS